MLAWVHFLSYRVPEASLLQSVEHRCTPMAGDSLRATQQMSSELAVEADLEFNVRRPLSLLQRWDARLQAALTTKHGADQHAHQGARRIPQKPLRFARSPMVEILSKLVEAVAAACHQQQAQRMVLR